MSDLFDQTQERLNRFAAPQGAAEEAAALRQSYWRGVNARQAERSALREANIGKYKVYLADEDYAILNNAIANAAVPEDEAYRMAAAIELTKQYDMPLHQARANLDQYVAGLFGTDEKYHIPKTAFNAVWGAGRNGVNTVIYGKLGNELKRAEEAGDEARINLIAQELDVLERENAEFADYQSRNFVVEALKFGAQSAPFTGYVAAAGIIGGLFNPFAGTAASMAASMELAGGSEYLELRKAGVNHEIAQDVSLVSGVIQGAIEIGLGNVASLAGGALKQIGRGLLTESPTRILIGKLASDVFKKLHYGGTFRRVAGRIAMEYFGEALEEGLEEVLQELTSVASRQVAASLQGEGVETATAREAAAQVAEAFRGGAMGSLVMGIPGTVLNARASTRSALAVKAMAETTDSKEAFVKETADAEVFEGMSEEKRKAAQEAIYDKAARARDKSIEKELAEVKETMDLGEGAAERESAPDEEGNTVRKKEFRTEAGSLYIDHKQEAGTGGAVSGIFKAGNALEETSHNRYGHISYEQDGDRVVVSEFQMAPGWEYLREELYRDFAQHFSGYDIAWDPQTDAGIEIKERLESQNPRGENAGLSYYADPATAADDRVRSEIISRTLERTSKTNAVELSAVLDLFESMIKPKGLGLAEAWDDWFDGEKITGKTNEAVDAAQKNGTVVKGAASFAQAAGQAKALIYVSRNADASTLLHEFSHVAEAHFTPEERRIAARALNGVTLERNGQRIAIAFDENAERWTNDQREAFADNLETYLATGAAPEAIKPLFEKIKEFMRRIYRTIRDAIPLSSEAKQFYESLITGDLARQAEGAEKMESAGLLPTTPGNPEIPGPITDSNSDVIDSAEPVKGEGNNEKIVLGNPNTERIKTILENPQATLSAKTEAAFDLAGDLFQAARAAQGQSPEELAEARRQYDEIVSRYTNPDGSRAEGWMQAPNGKPTNLTESQWVQVRTPAFKAWFGDWETEEKRKLQGIKTGVVTGNLGAQEAKKAFKTGTESGAPGASELSIAQKLQEVQGNISQVRDENGEPLPLYHQTTSFFEIFETRREGAGTSDHETPYGIFLKDTNKDIGLEGQNQIPLFADIKNPLRVENRQELARLLQEMPEYANLDQQLRENDKKRQALLDAAEAEEDTAYKKWWEENQKNPEAPYRGSDKANEILQDWKKTNNGIENRMKELVNQYLKDRRYDGIDLKADEGSFGRRVHTTIALENTQIKSATDNAGTFSNDNPSILFQIIGEWGAGALDQAEEATTRLDNLDVARQMETAGKDAKAIRLATGWERGMDGLWRYEIADITLKEGDTDLPKTDSAALGELVDAPELFAAYPRLSEMKTRPAAWLLPGIDGQYAYNEIWVSRLTQENKLSVLTHEIQHAIQEIEGFARGGNENQFTQQNNKRSILDDIDEARKKAWDEIPEDLQEAARKINRGEDTDGSALELIQANPESKAAWADYIRALANAAEIEGMSDEQFDGLSPEEQYHRLAGEVEARNAQTRMDFVPQQRLETLLADTEDVSREDQIFLANGAPLGTAMAMMEAEGRKTRENIQAVHVAIAEIADGAEEAIAKEIRPDLAKYGGNGNVTFIWGDEKKGLYHIGYRRGPEVVANVVKTVLTGAIAKYTDAKKTVTLADNGYEAVLSLDRNGENQTWLLTGWKENEPDATGEVSAQSGATQNGPTFSRSDLGAGTLQMLNDLAGEVKDNTDNAGTFSNDNPSILFQKAYHGTPHEDIIDRFSTGFVGTGEGGGKYGWGIYSSSRKRVAESYRKDLSSYGDESAIFLENGKEFDIATVKNEKLKEILQSVMDEYFPPDRSGYYDLSELLLNMSAFEDMGEEGRAEYRLLGLSGAHYKLKSGNEGHEYEIEIPDDDDLLDWDKPLHEQSAKIREIFKNDYKEIKNFTGKEIYRRIAFNLGSDKKASLYLIAQGIPGHIYLGEYRNAGEGKAVPNYVIYDDSVIEITDTLFQTQEELEAEAMSFDNWPEFMEYEETMRSEDSRIPENADAQWFQTFWETVHGISSEESAINSDLDERWERDDASPNDPQTMDALWMAVEMTKAGLTKFLERIGSIIKTDFEHWRPMNAEDAAERDRTAALKDRIIRELRHVSWLTNASNAFEAAKGVKGKELSTPQYRTLRTLIRNSVRDYRSLYAEIMDAPEYAVALADTTSAELNTRIADPDKAAVDLMSPEQRRRLAEELDIEDVSRELENGTLKIDDERLEKAWKKTKEDQKALAQKLQDLQQETEEDYRRISDYQTRQLLRLAEEMYAAKFKWKNRSDKTARMIERGLSITKKYEHESQQIRANYNALFRKFSDLQKAAEATGFVREALARREAQFDERIKNDDLNRKARALAEIKRMRTQLVKRFNRRVRFDRIDYKNAVLIIAIQRMMHPSMIRGVNRWLGTEGPLLRAVYSQYTTDSAFRAKLLDSVAKRSARAAGRLHRLLDKPYAEMTKKDRQEIYKLLPKQDWVMDLGLLELEKERREAIQLDITENKNDKGEVVSVTLGEELARMMDEALPYDLYARIQNRPYADWNLEEMEQLAKVVDDLYTQGRREYRAKQEARKLRDEGYRESIAKTITDAGIEIESGDSPEEKKKKLAKIDRILGKFAPGVSGTRQNSRARQGRLKRILAGYGDANIRRVARILDNGKDGINTTLLYWLEDKAFNQKQQALRRRWARVEGSMKDLGITLGDLTKKIVFEDFFKPGKSQEFTVEELLHVLLSEKEEQNKAAVMYGNFLDETEKDPYRDTGISDDELFKMSNIAQGRYDRVIGEATKYFSAEGNEKFLKFAEAIERDYADNGERMNRFTIEEFNMPMWRVDYYLPMNRLESTGETNANRVLEDLAGISAASNRNYVNKGMAKKRIDISPERQTPIKLGLYSTWVDSVERTEHLMAYGSLVRTLNSVYKSRDGGAIRQEIQDRYGDGMTGYINEYINELANPWASGQMTALDSVARALRGKTATAYLAWKTSGVVKQALTSAAPFFQYMNPKEYAAAALDFATHLLQTSEAIKSKSMHMATRVFDPMLDLIREQHEKTENPVAHALNKFNERGMKGLELIDWGLVAPGWLAVYRRELARLQKENQAGYEKLLAKHRAEGTLATEEARAAKAESEILGEDEIEEKAVALADDIVRLVQPSSRLTDLAPMFKSRGPNSEIARIFLQFQTSLNVIWQNIRYDMPWAIRQKKWLQVVGGTSAYVAASIALGLVTEGLGCEDDKKKKKGKEVSWQQRVGFYATTQFTDSIPIIGSQVTAWTRKLITGKGSYMPTNLFPVEKEFFDTITAAADALEKQSENKKKEAKAAWLRSAGNFTDLLGYVFGLPVSGTKEGARTLGIGDGDGKLGFNPGALLGRR